MFSAAYAIPEMIRKINGLYVSPIALKMAAP